MIKPEEYSLITLLLTKKQIESFDFTEVYPFLMSFKENPRKYFNKLNIIIHGYDNDSRELYEIKEIRDYLTFLDKSFPYWFYFCSKKLPKTHSPIGIIITCTCEIESIVHQGAFKSIQFNIESLNNFMNIHFQFLFELMKAEGYSEQEIEQTSLNIIDIIK